MRSFKSRTTSRTASSDDRSRTVSGGRSICLASWREVGSLPIKAEQGTPAKAQAGSGAPSSSGGALRLQQHLGAALLLLLAHLVPVRGVRQREVVAGQVTSAEWIGLVEQHRQD